MRVQSTTRARPVPVNGRIHEHNVGVMAARRVHHQWIFGISRPRVSKAQ